MPRISQSSRIPKRPVPILLAVRELHHGGIERDVAKIAIALDRSRFEPHVASFQAEGLRFEELTRAGVPILHLPVTSLKSPTAFRAAVQMRRYIRQYGIRLVHAYDTSVVFIAPVARALGVPAVLSSNLGHRDLLCKRTRRLVRWTDKIVDAVVVNCEAMHDHMTSEERVPRERVDLCYNGVDTGQFYPLPTSKPPLFADASFVIGAVCVLRPEKALDLLQEAFARVRHLRPGMKLVLVGSGPELERLRTNGRNLRIDGDCVFVPSTALVPQFLRTFDIFVLSSRLEAFSNALLEAMACGCCVVGSRVGGTPELIGGNEERGLLFQSGDVGHLAGRLSKLILNEELRRDFGSRAAQFAKTTLSIERAAACMADIYERVLRQKDPYMARRTTARMFATSEEETPL